MTRTQRKREIEAGEERTAGATLLRKCEGMGSEACPWGTGFLGAPAAYGKGATDGCND